MPASPKPVSDPAPSALTSDSSLRAKEQHGPKDISPDPKARVFPHAHAHWPSPKSSFRSFNMTTTTQGHNRSRILSATSLPARSQSK